MDFKNNSKIFVVDFDTPLYRYCMMLQENYIEVQYKDTGRIKEFKNKTEFKGSKKTVVGGWLGGLNKERKQKGLDPFLLKDFTISNKARIIIDDEIAKKHLREYVAELQSFEWVKSLKICLGGEDNFRYKIFPEYKKGRPPKPLRFKAIKRWFCEEFSDIITLSDGSEADDFCSIMGWWGWKTEQQHKAIGKSWENPVIIGGIDKDLLQIPGYHFNLDKRDHGIIIINEYQAAYNLAMQCLIGDGTDNINGLPEANKEIQEKYAIKKGGIGKVKAEKILKCCDTIECLFNEVQVAYKLYYEDEYRKYLDLNYKLVKLQEEKGKIPEFDFGDN